jgi:hypothetical protein
MSQSNDQRWIIGVALRTGHVELGSGSVIRPLETVCALRDRRSSRSDKYLICSFGKAKQVGVECFAKAKRVGVECFAKAKRVGVECFAKAKQVPPW